MDKRPMWQDLARKQIALWYTQNGLYQDDPEHMALVIGRVEQNFLSESHFWRIGRLCDVCLNELGKIRMPHILHLGSAWSFSALYIKNLHPNCRVTAIDDAGRYAWTAAAVLEQLKNLFSDVHIPAAGKTRLEDYHSCADCLLVTPPFRMTNSGHDRKLLALNVLQITKPEGVAIIQINRKIGNISPADLKCVLKSAGFATIKALAEDFTIADDAQKTAYLLASGKKLISKHIIVASLKSANQTGPAIIAQAGLPESFVSASERIAQIRRQVRLRETELRVPPPYLSLIGAEKCNLHCVFCVLDDRLVKRNISEVWMADTMRQIEGFAGISLSGGEILMHKPCLDLIRHAANTGKPPITVVSNLALQLDNLHHMLAEGIAHLNCSMDAATATTYSRLRLRGNFETVTHNLRSLAKLRTQTWHKQRLSMNFIVNAYNLREIKKFVVLACDIGVEAVIFKSLVFYLTSRIQDDIKIDYTNTALIHELAQQIVEGRKIGKKHGILVNFTTVPYKIQKFRPDIFAEYEKKGLTSPKDTASLDFQLENEMMPDGLMPCLAPFTTLACHPANNAFFCCDALQPYRSIPVDPCHSLQETFNQHLFQQARKHFLEGKYENVCSPFCGKYQQYLLNCKTS